MNQVRALFLRASRPDSLILRTAMWSSWSHVALIMPGAFSVVDATFWHGVSERGAGDALRGASKFEIKHIECPDQDAAYAFARSQIGKPYDTLGVLGVGLHRDWQEEDRWFCSEFLEACLAAGGNQRFVNQTRRVTTQHSWMVR